MLRTIDLVMIGLLLGGAAFTFKVKRDSETAIANVEALQKKIKAEQDSINILKADWSLLSDPQRLEALVELYKDQLNIAPLDPKTIGTIDEIPEKPIKIPQSGSSGIAGIIEEANDGVVTGAIPSGADQEAQN